MTEIFDPEDHQDPVRALVHTLRGTPVGRAVRLADGTMIKSVPVRHGATYQRRFAVSRHGRSPLPHVGSLINTLPTAQEAAQAALKKGRS